MSKLYIVMYHYVRDLSNSRYPSIKGLDNQLFKQQIQYISTNFKEATLEELFHTLLGGGAERESKDLLPEKSMLLTFDDGYIDHYTYVLPILNEFNMQGSFFVSGKVFAEHCLLDVNKIQFLIASTPIDVLCKELFKQMNEYRCDRWIYPSNEELYQMYARADRFDDKDTVFFKRMLQVALPEKLRGLISSTLFHKYMDVPEEVLAREIYLNYDQMLFMKRSGMFFGIHGYEHYWMNKLQPEELSQDIQKSLDCMGDLIDKDCWVINYPYGSYSNEVVESLKNSGCVCGLSTDVRVADLRKDHNMILPRLDTNDFPPKSDHYKNF